MKEVVKAVEIKQYIAKDGTPFTSEYQCREYEREQKQLKLEIKAIKKLGIESMVNIFPSMIDPNNEPKYTFFSIKDEKDLDIFCKAYESYWFCNRAPELNRDTFTYPDVLCLLDFEQGQEQHRLYKMSWLFDQFEAFKKELSEVVDKQ